MGFFDKISDALKKKDLIFSAYMINRRESEFVWRPRLEEICKSCFAQVKIDRVDIEHEVMRLNMLADTMVLENGSVPDYVPYRLEVLQGLMSSGFYLTGKVFNIDLVSSFKKIEEERIAPETLKQLLYDAEAILNESKPWYLVIL